MAQANESAATHPIDTEGTAEATWRAWDGLERAAPLDVSGISSAVVVAPHPDDEVLGVGGALALLAQQGARLRIVAVTDGEGSHPNSPTLSPPLLAERRRDERAQALRRLGAESAEVVRLGVGDGDSTRARDELTERLSGLCSAFDVCAAPWPGDLHPDHEAAGAAALAAVANGTRPLLYPVWMWHWARPDHPDVPWPAARRLELPPWAQRRKAAALDCFTTQTAPLSTDPADAAVLKPEMLAHFSRDCEVVFG
ncbi:PIG-L deacetylase family protein [Streptomonospora litoralis]|uniref:1D-myo-inositol 2-acetamido-2-deoxy-alpha-D-glucopyranoside deacetylase n=1 Tax=Streptomonospora litoralis TaxID=2498135 RepID=A0A4P6QAS7_9ACTN|nr:PIG-L family deacetylase [Streptomonospora litoralis]QBI56594.1 1D-myo-inositol 2-acetamido-2-deoxy-alpha-D-glucopyranoside deacetylase [Streptomonospora litoralis]